MDSLSMSFMFLFVVGAVIQDMLWFRISNRLILLGIITAMSFRIIQAGVWGIIPCLINIGFPVVALYLIYLMGAIGAGDIKLFSMIGSYIQFQTLLWTIAFAFMAGAVISILVLFRNKNFWVSLSKAGRYLAQLTQGKKISYQKMGIEQKNIIHFSLAILMGVIIAVGRSMILP